VSTSERFDFAGPVGRLEGILMHPATTPVGAAVVCHAHPLHGGIMHFKVVFRAAKALQEAGLAALRFNFRGVGRSEGRFDHGIGEQDDAAAALDEMERRYSAPIVLGGFSFGSAVALRVAARDPRVRAVFALGYPASIFTEHPHLDARGVPRLFVQGEHDRFASGEALRALVEPRPGRDDVVVVPGADHFFEGGLDVLRHAVERWATSRPWETV
jgi:alpha/beta superfamily hydrolase